MFYSTFRNSTSELFQNTVRMLLVFKNNWMPKFNGPLKPHSHCADVATVHPDAVQPVYRVAPGHIS